MSNYAVQQAEMESSLQELKKLVSWGWTYAVIWKIGPDHKTPVWHQSCLNESLTGTVVGPAQRFESIYRQCQFTPARPGYAYLAWQQQSPFWWTRLSEPVLTDKNKELFLAQVGIQTIVCFPRRVIPNGSGYCVELACTALVSETEFLRSSIQEFLNTSIDPYISTTTTGPPGMQQLQELAPGLDIDLSGPGSAMAALAHQTSAILTDITSQASMGEDEAIEGFGNMLRREDNLRQHLEPYLPWTMSSSIQASSAAAAGSNFQPFEGLANYPNFHDLSFNYGSPLLPSEPFSNIQTQPSAEWASSRKGKEILVEQSDLVLAPGGNKPSLNLPQGRSFNLLQQELLDKLRSPPASAAPPSPKTLPSGNISSGFQLGRQVGKMPPGHSPTSRFQRPHSWHVPSNLNPRVPMKKKQCLIVKWATSLAHRTARIRDDMLPADRGGLRAGSSFDGSPGTDVFDPRSPNSVAHDHQAAVAHKIAERNRRMKFSHKLQTLISIVPMINKKKDKVSVLTSTIDYIRQLNLRISTLKKGEAAPSTSRMEEGAAATTSVTVMDREEKLTTVVNDAEAGTGPSSSSPMASVVVVVVEEGLPGDDKWVIKVEANYRPRSLIQLLNVLLELELGVVTVDYGSTNGRFHANICVKNSRNLSTTSSELQAMLCRVLETSDSPFTGSD